MKSIDIGDITLRVLDRGSGVPLLLVHGFPLDHSMWRRQIDFFSEHCRMIAPDLRGFGQSGVTEGVVTMEQHADDLNRLLDAMSIHQQVVFCGLSMGGYVGWQFWRKYNERVAAFVACDTRAVADTPEAAENRLKMAERVMAEGPVVAVDAMLPKLFAESTFQDKPEMVEAMRQVILGTDPKGIAAALRGMAQRPDVRDMLPKIAAPTLVIVGEHDGISKVDEMREIADAIPDSAWVVIPHAGHMSPLENPDVFNDALAAFLTL